MPTLYLWMGFRFFFYSHEHEPVHIHVECEDRQTVFELLVENGEVTEITTRSIPGYDPLGAKDERMALQLIQKYKAEILNSWITFFVHHQPVEVKDIRTKFLP